MFKDKHIYHITHGVDMDGLTCSSLIKQIPSLSYTYSFVKVYTRLLSELDIASQKLKEGYIVIISDLCFYEEDTIAKAKQLLTEYPDQFIILDHHLDTVKILTDMKKSQYIGYSDLTVKHYKPTNSAAYITLTFLKELSLPTDEYEEFVSYVSIWDTFDFSKNLEEDYPFYLQCYYMTNGNKAFLNLLKNPKWKEVISYSANAKDYEEIISTCDYVANRSRVRVLDKATIIQIQDSQKIFGSNNKYAQEDINESICYRLCSKGENVVALVNSRVCIFRGRGNSIEQIASVYKIPHVDGRNILSFLEVNLHQSLLG